MNAACGNKGKGKGNEVGRREGREREEGEERSSRSENERGERRKDREGRGRRGSEGAEREDRGDKRQREGGRGRGKPRTRDPASAMNRHSGSGKEIGPRPARHGPRHSKGWRAPGGTAPSAMASEQGMVEKLGNQMIAGTRTRPATQGGAPTQHPDKCPHARTLEPRRVMGVWTGGVKESTMHVNTGKN